MQSKMNMAFLVLRNFISSVHYPLKKANDARKVRESSNIQSQLW